LEIGFGKGEFLLKMASLFPEELFIGCEPFMSGVAHVLQDVAKHNIANIRIFNSDARILLSQIALPLFNRIFILFPDPWPKARHHKRRIINRFLLDQLLLLLKTKGQIHIVTDSDNYAVWIDTLLKDTSELKHLEEKLKIDNFNTSYYQKAKKNNNQIHIFSYYK
jgi:tRNA (guanine-N7-)-methyltransferase